MNTSHFGLFTLICALMVVITLAALIWTLLKGRSQAGDIRRARYALHDTILAELDEDLRYGRLSESDHASARIEAESRLINEVGSASPMLNEQSARGLVIALLLILPLAAGALYFKLGTPSALDPSTRQRPNIGPNEIAAMVKKLEARMILEPNDQQGWLMLARSYRSQARYSDAINAYEKAWPAIEKDAGEIARFAGVLAIEQKSFKGKPSDLLVKALSVNASEPDALMLAGSAAIERGDKAAAKEWWNKLLILLEVGSEDEQWLKEEIRLLDKPNDAVK